MAASNHLSVTQFQFLLGMCSIVFALFQLVSIPVIAALGTHRSAAASCIALTMGSIILSLNTGATGFGLVFLSMFAVNSIGANATRLTLRDASSEAGFKRLLAWASSAVEIKQIAIPFIAGAMITGIGWRWALIVLVTPIFATGIWLVLVSKNRPIVSAMMHVGIADWQKIVSMPAFFIPTLTQASFQLAFSPVTARLPFLLSGEAGLSPLMTGLVLSSANALVATGLLVSGYLAPRCSSRSLIKTGVAIMCAGLSCMLASKFLDIHYAIAGMILMQAAFGFIVIPCTADAINTPKADRVSASALFGFLQPFICGLAVVFAGSVNTSGINMAIVMTMCSVTLILLLLALHTAVTHY